MGDKQQVESEEKSKFTGVFVPAEVLANPKTSGVEKFIISDVGYLDGGYRLSNLGMAKKFGVSRRTIINSVSRLKAKGFLVDLGRDDYHRNLKLNGAISTLFENRKGAKTALLEREKGGGKTYDESSEEFRLATLLLDLILERKPDFKRPDLQSWAKHIDLMIRLDGRRPERVEGVIRWCQQDNGDGRWRGWQDNILSPVKLREKFDRIELSMKGKNENGSGAISRSSTRSNAGFPNGIR